jgi:hypothetical protein
MMERGARLAAHLDAAAPAQLAALARSSRSRA